MEQKKVGIIGHGGLGRSSMQAAMIHSLMMQKGVKLITAEPEVIDQRGGVLTADMIERVSQIEPDAFSGHISFDLGSEEKDRGLNIIYMKNEDGTMTRIGTTDDKLPEFKSSRIGSLQEMADEDVKQLSKKITPLEVAQTAYFNDGRSARNIRRAKERNKKKGRW